MNILYFFYPVIIFIGFFFLKVGDTEKTRRAYICIILTLLTLESCLRGVSVGSDTENYLDWWKSVKYISWSQIFTDFYVRYSYNDGTNDVGFEIYTKALQVLSDNFQYFLLVSALCFFIPFGMLLQRYIKKMYQLIFIFIFYVSLFNPIAMSGVRKEIALGFTILAFLYYTDKKYLKMLIVLAISTTIHMSTLLFILTPLLGYLRPSKLRIIHIAAFLLIPIVIVLSSSIIVFMGEAVSNEKYADYGRDGAQGGAVVFTFMIELLSLFCFVAFRKVLLERTPLLAKLYIMLPCFTFFAPLITNNGSMIRISQYFHVYLIILIPYAIEELASSTDKKIYYLGMAFVLMLLALFNNSSDYCFFWQDEFGMMFVDDYYFIV